MRNCYVGRRVVLVSCLLAISGCSGGVDGGGGDSAASEQDSDLEGCPRNASDSYKAGWAKGIRLARTRHKILLSMREDVDQGKPMDRILVQTTEQTREDLEKALEHHRNVFKHQGEERAKGEADGIDYALRNILKSRY